MNNKVILLTIMHSTFIFYKITMKSFEQCLSTTVDCCCLSFRLYKHIMTSKKITQIKFWFIMLYAEILGSSNLTLYTRLNENQLACV